MSVMGCMTFHKWISKEQVLLTDSPACAGKLWPLYLEFLLCFQLECLNSGRKQEPSCYKWNKTKFHLYYLYSWGILVWLYAGSFSKCFLIM